MKTWTTTLLAAAASFALVGVASAQETGGIKEPAEAAAPEDSAQEDESPFDVSFNVGVATDYAFRGVSQTSEEEFQVFGGVDVTSGIFYAGAWASNVNFSVFGDNDTSVEVDVYAGVKPEIGGFTFDFAGIYYHYIDQPENAVELGFFEAKAAVSRAVGPATLGAALYYSPEFTGEVGDAVYYEGNAAYTVNDRFSVSGALGRQTYNDLDDADYTTWNVGTTIVLTPYLSADIRYWDTDEDDLVSPVQDIYEGRVIGTLKAVF